MIVGTAGHIDHGKTALVRALTGTDTDRLAEEKKRGISIDLGFAYREMPNGQVMGFVDVPGHERFMKNMLAGASGIDLVLLAVAADDGIMPQTREHLAVIELLGIEQGIVALTKCDIVEEGQQDKVERAIRELTAGGSLAGSRIFRVSAHTSAGIGGLRAALDTEAARIERRVAGGRFRFAVDRSFSLKGAGTIATGVVMSGQVKVGDTVTISPSGKTARVRALHVQNRPGEIARQGQRCGINLSGTEAGAVERGDFLLAPELHAPSARIDCEMRLLPDAARPLRHWHPVRLHHAAAEVQARAALLQDEPIAPGETGRVQLVLDHPIAAAIGDRCVLRDGNGSSTIGGGRIVDLRPPQRRRTQVRRLDQFQAMALADPAASLAAQLGRWPWFVERDTFTRDRALGAGEAEAMLASVEHRQAGTFLFGPDVWEGLESTILEAARQFHDRFPQLLGPNLQRLVKAAQPALPRAVAEAVLGALVEQGKLARQGGVYRLREHRLGLDRADTDIWLRIEPLLGGANRFRPPRLPELADMVQRREFDLRRVLKSMARQGKVVEIAPDYFVLGRTMQEAARIVGEIVTESADGSFGAAQLRDRLENGRKVAIWMLEFFDRHGLTLRRGDLRTIDPKRLARFTEEAADAA